MGKISFNDIIFATATIRGEVAACLRLSGLGSISDVIKAIKGEIGSTNGLLTINLRNMTQGWSGSKAVYMSTVPVMSQPGKQLSLF